MSQKSRRDTRHGSRTGARRIGLGALAALLALSGAGAAGAADKTHEKHDRLVRHGDHRAWHHPGRSHHLPQHVSHPFRTRGAYFGYPGSHGYASHPVGHRYYCRACDHHFESHHALYGHVTRHHHVPFWQVPLLIAFQSGFGYVYHH